MVKELGKKAGSNFERFPAADLRVLRPQRKIVKRLFIKNTGLCKSESLGIGAETCPLPEG